MRTRVAPAVIALLCWAAVTTGAGTARAGVVAGSVLGYEAGPVVTDDGSLVVAERTPGGGEIRAFAPQGGAPRTLTALPSPSPGLSRDVSLVASGDTAAGVVRFVEPCPKPCEGITVFSQAFDARTGIDLGRCAESPGLGVAAGRGFVALYGADCTGPGAGIRIRDAAGERLVGTPDADGLSSLQAAGDHVAWAETRRGGPAFVGVVASGDGRVLLRVAIDTRLASFVLAADGRLYWSGAGGRTGPCDGREVFWASPDSPAPQRVTGGCPLLADGDPVDARDGDVLMSGERELALVRHGAVRERFRPPAGVTARNVTLLSGRAIAYVLEGCAADRVVTHRVDETPPAAWRSIGDCPISYAGTSRRLRLGADGTIALRVRCRVGCRGRLAVMQGGRASRRWVSEAGEVVSDGGLATVRVRLHPAVRRWAACAGGVRLSVRHVPRGRFGSRLYRDASLDGRDAALPITVRGDGRCSRRGGPRFVDRRRSLDAP